MVLLHIFQGGGGPTFSRGGSPIETHITIPCDFSGGGLDRLSPSGSAHRHCGILARIGSDEPVRPPFKLETSNANWSIGFKRLAKALLRLHICAGWSKPLVLAHTTLLEISYCGPFIGAKNALRLYTRTKLHLSHKAPVIFHKEYVTTF